MLKIKKTVIALEEIDLIELERIITDDDKEDALMFLRKNVFERVLHSQKGKLKSHLDGESKPAEKFKGNTDDI